jgi:hypothetical protein
MVISFKTFATDHQPVAQAGHVPDQPVHAFGRGHAVHQAVVQVVRNQGDIDEHGLERQLTRRFEDVAAEDRPPHAEPGMDLDHDFLVAVRPAGIGFRHSEPAPLVPAPAAQILAVDPAILKSRDMRRPDATGPCRSH